MNAAKKTARTSSKRAARTASGSAASSTPYYIPTGSVPAPGAGQLVSYKRLADMDDDEGKRWLAGVRARLEQKMARERAYLDRRAMRGTRTPTDDAYEADQALEAELLALLDELIQRLP